MKHLYLCMGVTALAYTTLTAAATPRGPFAFPNGYNLDDVDTFNPDGTNEAPYCIMQPKVISSIASVGFFIATGIMTWQMLATAQRRAALEKLFSKQPGGFWKGLKASLKLPGVAAAAERFGVTAFLFLLGVGCAGFAWYSARKAKPSAAEIAVENALLAAAEGGSPTAQDTARSLIAPMLANNTLTRERLKQLAQTLSKRHEWSLEQVHNLARTIKDLPAPQPRTHSGRIEAV